ncbi:MAG: acyl-CoA/acyl-ACP dehydrogenase [Streptosporangiaceae bacterium]|nr:acyl-CoA/acyl-ACP dehydrogenase [Streptosporangiaceae bacterium]
MDFELSETQQEIARLAADVLSAADPWKELARSGLLAIAVPAELGGDGLGVLEVAVLLTEVGRKAVSVPALATLMTGVLPIARWGDEALQRALLPAAAAGELTLCAAIRETSHSRPTTVDGCRVSGVKVGVPYAAQAGRILVSAGTGVVLVDPAADGVTITRTPSSSGDPEYTVRLDQAPAAGTLAMEARDLHRLATAGACCLADGALAGALALTRDYIATRRQFGRALAEFQAVSGQIADVYITSRTLHLITLSACWRLAASLDPDSDLDAAAWWVTEEAVRSVLSCHHMHGGVGVDISYPLHRFSSLIRDLSRFLGGASVH